MTTDTIQNIPSPIMKKCTDKNIAGQFSYERIGTPANEINSMMKNLHRELIEEFNLRVEYALRSLIAHPIKGEITKGKLKWRGIKCKVLTTPDGEVFCNDNYVGRTFRYEMNMVLMQRGMVIDLNFPADVMERYEQWKKRR